MTLSFAASITNFGHTSLCHGGVCSVMKQSLLLPANPKKCIGEKTKNCTNSKLKKGCEQMERLV
jgi:hypothetical protein